MHPILLLAAAAQAADPTPEPSDILVTGSREPVEQAQSVSMPVTLREVRPGPGQGLPMTTDFLRLTPGVSVSVSGPRGSLTQVRIRGAEANHTLLFVDGIRFNDPAAGNEARFELLAADMAEQVEIARIPASALWGTEALGGVVAIRSPDSYWSGRLLRGLAEYGGLDSSRAAASIATEAGKVRLSGTATWMRGEGVDSFGAGGERDGFDNRSASAKLVFAPVGNLELGLVAHHIEGQSEYDGFDPVTFRRADTLDETRNRISAARTWAEAERRGWKLTIDGSALSSTNRNFLGGSPLNGTSGLRFTTSGQLSKTLGGHRVTIAAEHQGENFRSRDQAFFGASDQDRSRSVTSVVGEWRAEWHKAVTTQLAVRHDGFSAFRDATTLRAGLTVKPVRRIEAYAGYSEGIAQPTFYDLYGFFPGSFTGNPVLAPERSSGWHGGIRFGNWARSYVGLNAFTATLDEEIVDVFDPATFRSTTANATGTSRRRGIDVEGQLDFGEAARLQLNYSLLDAEERQVAGGLAVREVRRARHSANLAGQGRLGRFGWAASIAYVGKRRDVDFDQFPARPVVLDPYFLASLQLSWDVSKELEAFARAENLFDSDYQDVFGYNTPGRTVHAGLRLRFRL